MKKTTWIAFLFFGLGLGVSLLLYRSDRWRPAVPSAETGKAPERIVCAAPSVTEVVFALGRGNRVIAVSEFTAYPPEALNREKIGGLVNVNYERITALRPDVVITQGKSQKLETFCRRKSIAYLTTSFRDLTTIYKDIRHIGAILHCEDEAARLNRQIKSKLGEVRRQAAEFAPLKVFLCLSRQKDSLRNVMTAGQGTFLNELLNIAGGDNVFGELTAEYPQVSMESLVARKPQVILEMRPFLQPTRSSQQILEDWNQLDVLPAVANERVHLVTADFMLIPGPRIPNTAALLFHTIHQGTRP